MSETVPYYAFNRITRQLDMVGHYPPSERPVLDAGVYGSTMSEVELDRILDGIATQKAGNGVGIPGPSGEFLTIRRREGKIYEIYDIKDQLIPREIHRVPSYVTDPVNLRRALRHTEEFRKNLSTLPTAVLNLVDTLHRRGDVVVLEAEKSYRPSEGTYSDCDQFLSCVVNERAFDDLYRIARMISRAHYLQFGVSPNWPNSVIRLGPTDKSVINWNHIFSMGVITVLDIFIPLTDGTGTSNKQNTKLLELFTQAIDEDRELVK